MTLMWNKQSAPIWDVDKQRIIGGAPDGAFDLDYVDGRPMAGEWWSVTDGDAVVGFGWLDIAWGDAEILLATAPEAQNRGVGGFVLDRLEGEAARRGVNYVYNTIRSEHPQKEELRDWLESHGYSGGDGGVLRKRVNRRAAEPVTGPAPTFDSTVDMGPGHEEAGGYVDPEQHRF